MSIFSWIVSTREKHRISREQKDIERFSFILNHIDLANNETKKAITDLDLKITLLLEEINKSVLAVQKELKSLSEILLSFKAETQNDYSELKQYNLSLQQSLMKKVEQNHIDDNNQLQNIKQSIYDSSTKLEERISNESTAQAAAISSKSELALHNSTQLLEDEIKAMLIQLDTLKKQLELVKSSQSQNELALQDTIEEKTASISNDMADIKKLIEILSINELLDTIELPNSSDSSPRSV